MTLPKGWQKPNDDGESRASVMPRLSLLSRPMVDLQSLKINGYEIKNIEIINEETGGNESLPNIRYFEIQPIDFTHLLVFTDGRSKQGSTMNLQDLREVKVVSTIKGRFSKKEDLIIEIKHVGPQDRKKYTMRMDVEDKYADQIVNEIMASKRAESDPVYWTHRSLNFTNQYGQKNTVDIYPLTPFLATGEEILWQIPRHDINDKKKKIIWIDCVTNYRIFQYSYVEHKGSVILFPSTEDIRIVNESRGNGFGEYNTSSPFLSGIQPSGVTGVVGNVVFYSQGSPWITFNDVTDPETLSIVCKNLNNQQANTIIGNGESNSKEVDQSNTVTEKEAKIVETNNLICSKCGNNTNPAGSKFCNSCGSSLNPSCPKCGNSNPPEALFCGQCGTKMN